MPYADKEKRKEFHKKYYQENKTEMLGRHKTQDGIKSKCISNWKQRGVISEDYSSLYDRYLNYKNCEICNIEFINDKRCGATKCLDHSHKTGLFRNFLCLTCNIKRREDN